METELREAMASGVLVEFRDASNHTLGQAVYFDWRGRPVPAVGDAICCQIKAAGAERVEKICGRVVARQFDIQTDSAGEPCVWVRVLASADTLPTRPRVARSFQARFSAN